MNWVAHKLAVVSGCNVSGGVIQVSRRARLNVADQRPHAHAQTPFAPR